MTLLANLLGANYRCEDCGTDYYRNPSKCGHCGYTVFRKVNH